MPVMFDTVDYGITSAEEWQRRFGQPLKFAKDKGRTVEAVYHPGGTIAVLIRNLKANALLEHVTNVIRGDFNNSPIARSYSMIFCDATHDEEEIRKNLPRLSELGGEGCVFVFDDIVTQEHADLVCSYLNASRHFMTRSMFPEPGKRCKLLLVETG
ncbi:hypothetical protein EV663_1116 [Rhodovulum bhavnagarense]|uniref:Uncharacterized protein n=2 Tax=Rhodovulum bhavnagarense TaxID=992286 RepID=A0A4R2RAB8_9RHOB|nr:hypothetical protein EV663_1116 [Rhodovulum bhavnagarense]